MEHVHPCIDSPTHSLCSEQSQKMVERVSYTITGAFLGAMIGLNIVLWWTDRFSWIPIPICAGAGAVLAFFWGEAILDWLKEIWWWT